MPHGDRKGIGRGPGDSRRRPESAEDRGDACRFALRINDIERWIQGDHIAAGVDIFDEFDCLQRRSEQPDEPMMGMLAILKLMAIGKYPSPWETVEVLLPLLGKERAAREHLRIDPGRRDQARYVGIVRADANLQMTAGLSQCHRLGGWRRDQFGCKLRPEKAHFAISPCSCDGPAQNSLLRRFPPPLPATRRWVPRSCRQRSWLQLPGPWRSDSWRCPR